MSSGASSGSTERIVDVEQEFKFPIPDELRCSNVESKYPDEKTLRRFIRDATACLQAIAGEEITPADLVVAATKICDTIPILKDPKPAPFPSLKRFPYWVIICFVCLNDHLCNC